MDVSKRSFYFALFAVLFPVLIQVRQIMYVETLSMKKTQIHRDIVSMDKTKMNKTSPIPIKYRYPTIIPVYVFNIIIS